MDVQPSLAIAVELVEAHAEHAQVLREAGELPPPRKKSRRPGADLRPERIMRSGPHVRKIQALARKLANYAARGKGLESNRCGSRTETVPTS